MIWLIAKTQTKTSMQEESLKRLQRVRLAIRARHYSPRTEEAYVDWIRRYVRFHGVRHPEEMGKAEIAVFLTHLGVERRLAASTLRAAL